MRTLRLLFVLLAVSGSATASANSGPPHGAAATGSGAAGGPTSPGATGPSRAGRASEAAAIRAQAVRSGATRAGQGPASPAHLGRVATATTAPVAAQPTATEARPLQPLRVPERLTPQERTSGLHLNRVTTVLAGNSHFPGWWDVVPQDTSVVVVQGSAYSGQRVTVGHESYDNAAVIYVRPAAGLREQTHLDIKGTAGEQVRVLYYRLAPSARLETQGGQTRITQIGQAAAIGGDPHFRDVFLTIQPTPSERAQPVPTLFNHHHPDHYDRTAQQQGRDTRGPKAFNALGGDADDARAAQRTIDPMFH